MVVALVRRFAKQIVMQCVQFQRLYHLLTQIQTAQIAVLLRKNKVFKQQTAIVHSQRMRLEKERRFFGCGRVFLVAHTVHHQAENGRMDSV